MKQGKSLTVLVLVLEIAFIAVLHAVKISEKAATKEMTRNSSVETLEVHQKPPFALAKY